MRHSRGLDPRGLHYLSTTVAYRPFPTRYETSPFPGLGASRRRTTVQPTWTSPRRRSRPFSLAITALAAVLTATVTGVLAPSAATAAPGTAAEAQDLAEKTAQQLTAVDEQVRQAEVDAAEQQQAAATAAKAAAVAQSQL